MAEATIRFSGARDDDGRWVARKLDGPDAGDDVTLTFDSLAAATDLASAQGWGGGVSVSSATYEDMLDAEAADPEGGQAANLTITDE